MRSRSEYQEYRCASVTDSCENKMRADGSRGGRVFSGICLFVCLSVCLSGFPHDISKTAAARIAKREIEMFHHESWKHFLGSKVKVARHKNSSGVGFALLHLPALLWLNYRHRFTLTVSKYCALNVMTDSLPPPETVIWVRIAHSSPISDRRRMSNANSYDNSYVRTTIDRTRCINSNPDLFLLPPTTPLLAHPKGRQALWLQNLRQMRPHLVRLEGRLNCCRFAWNG